MRFRERLFPFSWNAVTIFLLVTVAIIPAGLMWYWVSTNWVPLPFWDEWHTPGSQFESWFRGTLTLKEMFSQHNESRNFFPRLLYFALEHFGGWDVRKEIRVVFFGVCALCLLLLDLLRRTPGATPVSILVGWTLMTYLCFAPVQVENFLYGIEIETFFPGFALLVAAAINLSALSFRWKALANLALAFVATYTFANGMLVWALAWPLPAPNEPAPRQRRFIWSSIYALAGAISVGAYFIGYHRPSYHPAFASISARFLDLAHYVVLWSGNYFSTGFASPFLLGIIALDAVFQRRWFRPLDDLAARRLADILSLASPRGLRLRHGHDHGSWAVGLRRGTGARQSLLGVQPFFLCRALWPLLCDLLRARARCFSRRSYTLPHAYGMGALFPRAFLGGVLREKSCGAGRASSDPWPSPTRLGMDGADSG